MSSHETPSVSEVVNTLADVKRIITELDVFLTPFSTSRGMYMGCFFTFTILFFTFKNIA